MNERLNKVLARAGLGSRRSTDTLISAGRVRVNGEVVRQLGSRVDAATDAISVDGKRIPGPPREHTYLMLNKPRGYVTTLSDPEGRKTVLDLVKGNAPRLFPVGRLDYNSEGLLLLTDDGELGEVLMHPRSGVPKTYSVKVRGVPVDSALVRLRKGVVLDRRPTGPARVEMKHPGHNSWLEVTIHEGRKHHVRRMFEAVGHRVQKLRRIGYAGLVLGELPPGGVRPLTRREVGLLQRAATPGQRPRTRHSDRRN